MASLEHEWFSRRAFFKLLGAAAAAFGLPVSLRAQTGQRKELNMKITRAGSQPSSKGPTDWFTGTVRIDPLFQTDAPARAQGATVTFEPGARTAWHTHPLGQTLIVTSGLRACAARGRADRRNPARRCRLVCA